MAASYATTLRNAKMDAITTFVGTGAKIRLYDGARPANPGTAIAGTLLVELTGNGSQFAGAASGGVLTLSAITNGTAVATGWARYCRVFKSDGTTACIDLNVAMNWVASTAVSLNQYMSNGGNTYKCTTAGTTASSGGPTGTGTGITDGSAVWAYVGTTDIVLNNVSIATGQVVSISSATITDNNA